MKKKTAEVSIDTSCPPPTFEDYHRFTMLDTRTNYKGYTLHNWFPASTRDFVIDKLGQVEDLMDKYRIKDVEELDNRIKALEIIKDKIMRFVSVEENCITDLDAYRSIELTKEEYDLLKEILL